jgi:hypothetical protein
MHLLNCHHQGTNTYITNTYSNKMVLQFLHLSKFTYYSYNLKYRIFRWITRALSIQKMYKFVKNEHARYTLERYTVRVIYTKIRYLKYYKMNQCKMKMDPGESE